MNTDFSIVLITHLFIVGTEMCMSIETLILHNSCCLLTHVADTFMISVFGLFSDPILFSNKCRTTTASGGFIFIFEIRSYFTLEAS